MPVVVGVWEAQEPRLTAEMAQLFEDYYQETRGLAPRQGPTGPSVHRVLPVGEAVSAQLDILPYQRAVDMVNQAQAWAVRRCICRVQRGLIGQGCAHTVDNCLSLAPVPGYFDGRPHVRALTRDEALEVVRAAADEGLVQTTMNVSGDSHYICNCCACCCGVLRAAKEFHSPAAVANSGLQAQVEAALCIACGQCVERCPMGALSLPEDLSVVEAQRCIGCGLCVMACPTDALSLVARPEAERIAPPKDLQEWMVQRARERDIPLEDVL
jgi:Fe-S-cluster-containing hydrogenase component 2